MPKVTPSVVLMQHNAFGEQLVASAAKLCYSNKSIEQIVQDNQQNDTSAFVDKLLSLGHLSPVEHVVFTFGIEGVSRALLAQITRHRIASFSVKSQRYTAASKQFNYVIPPAIQQLGADAVITFEQQMQTMGEWYEQWQQLLGANTESGNEDARFVLPNAAETKMIVTMNARELLHFFSLRCCFRAQWELRHVAWEMLRLCVEVAPSLFANAGAGCLRDKCPEGAFSCKRQQQVQQQHKKMMQQASTAKNNKDS